MKKLIYTKPIDHMLLGHLYEHMFCSELISHLRTNDLFAYVDYRLDAATYRQGYVQVELSLFSEKAIALTDFIPKLAIPLDRDSIDGGFIQIMAEKEADLEVEDEAYITETLKRYDALKWREGARDATSHSLPDDEKVYLVDAEQGAILELQQDILFENQFISNDPKRLLPLSVVLGNALQENLQEDIARGVLCYSKEDSFELGDEYVTVRNTFTVDARQVNGLSDEIGIASEMLSHMLRNGFFERLRNFLHDSTYEQDGMAPHEKEIENKTHIKPSLELWHELAETDIIQKLLSHTQIRFTLAGDTRLLSLVDVLDSTKQ